MGALVSNYQNFLSESFHCLVVKFLINLIGHVSVMGAMVSNFLSIFIYMYHSFICISSETKVKINK